MPEHRHEAVWFNELPAVLFNEYSAVCVCMRAIHTETK